MCCSKKATSPGGALGETASMSAEGSAVKRPASGARDILFGVMRLLAFMWIDSLPSLRTGRPGSPYHADPQSSSELSFVEKPSVPT